MGKRLKNDPKYAIFQNWLKTRPKVLNAQNKHVLHHFGGMLALNFFFSFGARSAIFWHLKMGTFGESARFLVPKNGTSSARIYERIPKTSRNTPQNGWVDIWVKRFHFRASIKPIMFLEPLGALFTLLKGRKTKTARIFWFMGL